MADNIALLYDELRFWTRIMKEHALFLRLGLPCNETRLIQLANDFEARYNSLEERLNCPPSDIDPLAQEILNLTLEFIQYKTLILDRLITCNLGGFNYPLLVDHLRREAINFAANIVRYRRGIMVRPVEELIEDLEFWMRIMADHSRFINHLLDPSERGLIKQTEMFSVAFDDLRAQAEDFESMLEVTPRPIPSLIRFSGEALQYTAELRDFKAAATRLISECKILSLIPPLLADHVRREADRAIQEIERALAAIGGEMMPVPCPPHGPMPPCPYPVSPAPGLPLPFPMPPCPPKPPCPGPVSPAPGLPPCPPMPIPYPVLPAPGLPFPEPPPLPFPVSPAPGLPCPPPMPPCPPKPPCPPQKTIPFVPYAGQTPESTDTEPVIEPVDSAVKIEPLESSVNTEETIESTLVEAGFSVPPQPIIRPRSNFSQPDTKQVKIIFK